MQVGHDIERAAGSSPSSKCRAMGAGLITGYPGRDEAKGDVEWGRIKTREKAGLETSKCIRDWMPNPISKNEAKR